MTYQFLPAPDVYVVVPGSTRCDHVPADLVEWNSLTATHKVWTCHQCRRIVRSDWKQRGPIEATRPMMVLPAGLEGIPYGNSRVWKMPESRSRPKAETKKPWRLAR